MDTTEYEIAVEYLLATQEKYECQKRLTSASGGVVNPQALADTRSLVARARAAELVARNKLVGKPELASPTEKEG